MLTVPDIATDLRSIWSTVFVSASSRCVATAEIPRLPDASGSIARFANSNDETVDQHTVSLCKKAGFVPQTFIGNACARISLWPACNSSPLARGRIYSSNWNRHSGELIKKVSPVWRLTTIRHCSVAFVGPRHWPSSRALVWPQANPLKAITIFSFCRVDQIGTSFEAPSLRAESRRPTFISWMTPRSMERRKKRKMSNPHQTAFYGQGASAKSPRCSQQFARAPGARRSDQPANR